MADLELNRFRKVGGNLVLEEYSSCEVPAGCGGAVLRWVRPSDPCTVEVFMFAPPGSTATIDGVAPTSGRIELMPGSHVLTIEIPVRSPILVRMRLPSRRVPRAALLTAADGAWRCAETPPPSEWTTAAFDDSSWSELVEGVAPTATARTDTYRIETLVKDGAVPLSAITTTPSEPLWVRRRFMMDEEGIR
jgi:hypothetical protein